MPRYEKFQVWQLAREVVKDIHGTVGGFTDCGGLGNQMRRAAISIASNIAEGAEKGSDAELRRFLRIASGSCGEAMAQLTLACDLELVDQQRHDAIRAKLDSVARMLQRFVGRLDSG